MRRWIGELASPDVAEVSVPRRSAEASAVVLPGYINSKPQIQARLNRLEGQVRGISHMVDEERYCIDILTQVNAVKAALDKVAVALLDDHVRHCVADAVRAGEGDAKIHELSAAIDRFLSG